MARSEAAPFFAQQLTLALVERAARSTACYGAFVLGPDGNNVTAVGHGPA